MLLAPLRRDQEITVRCAAHSRYAPGVSSFLRLRDDSSGAYRKLADIRSDHFDTVFRNCRDRTEGPHILVRGTPCPALSRSRFLHCRFGLDDRDVLREFGRCGNPRIAHLTVREFSLLLSLPSSPIFVRTRGSSQHGVRLCPLSRWPRVRRRAWIPRVPLRTA